MDHGRLVGNRPSDGPRGRFARGPALLGSPDVVVRNALSGDGKPMGTDDPHIEEGVDPSIVGRRIVRSFEGGSVEVKTGFTLKLRFALFLSRRFPSAYASMSKRHAGLE